MSENQRILQVLDCVSRLCAQTKIGYRCLSDVKLDFVRWGNSSLKPLVWDENSCVIEQDGNRLLYPVVKLEDDVVSTWTNVLGLDGVEVWFVKELDENGLEDRYVDIRFVSEDQSVVIQDGVWVLC